MGRLLTKPELQGGCTVNGVDVLDKNGVLLNQYGKYTVTAMTTSATITTAAILGGMISANQAAGGVATYTMPTGTVLAAALPATFAIGNSVDFTIVNVSTVSAEDVTLAGATGTTAKGNLFVPSNAATSDVAFGTFRAVMTGTNTFDVYRVA